jgi:hypothetical protein
MSMMGNYLRVTPDVLADLKANPDSILDFLYPDDGEGCHPEGRYLDVYHDDVSIMVWKATDCPVEVRESGEHERGEQHHPKQE